MNIAPVAKRLNSASYFNSVISGERFVPDLTIRRDRYSSWIATDRWRCNTFPLPVTKPPPQILGFGDIKIEMYEERGILEPLTLFFTNVAPLLATRILITTDLYWCGDRIIDNICEFFGGELTKPHGGSPFAAMFAEVEIPIASYCENPPRILRSQAVLNAGRLKLHADKFSGQTLIKMLSNWLFYRPLFEQPLRVLQAVGSKQPFTRKFVQHIAQVFLSERNERQEFIVIFGEMYLGNPDECQWNNEHTGELLTLGVETSHMDFNNDYVDYGQKKRKLTLRRRPLFGPILSIDRIIELYKKVDRRMIEIKHPY